MRGREREEILKRILPEEAKSHHEVLREIFLLEMEYRKADDEWEYYENLYWCGYLLYCIGDIRDVEMMWRAKQINMDTRGGFDVQTLVGAGVSETIEYLEKNQLHEIAKYLRLCKETGDFDRLGKWSESKKQYYYEGFLIEDEKS